MIQRRVFVTGRVQGVSYRANTAKAAAKHAGLKGFVRNLSDGRVEAVFQGDEASVLAMVEWCRKGPILAKVTALEVREESPDPSLGDFSVMA